MLVTTTVVVRGVKAVRVAWTVRVWTVVEGMICVTTRVVVRVRVLVVHRMEVRGVVRVWKRLLMVTVVWTTVVVRVMVEREVVVELMMTLVVRKSVKVVKVVDVVREVVVIVRVVIVGDVVRIVETIVRVVKEVSRKVRTVVLVIVITSTQRSPWARTQPPMKRTNHTRHQICRTMPPRGCIARGYQGQLVHSLLVLPKIANNFYSPHRLDIALARIKIVTSYCCLAAIGRGVDQLEFPQLFQ